MLLDHGANVDASNREGWTPLHCAVSNTEVVACKLLAEAGADPLRKDSEGKSAMDWFDLSTLKEPYRIEGKKTMGLELAEQFQWELPDVILYPTGGGTGLIGMWKAFHELLALGWLRSDKMPRMVSVQSAGCEPIARAYRNEERFADPHENAHTCASGLRVPVAVGDFMILDAVRQSGGIAISVDDGQIPAWTNQASAAEGISVCPETGACLGALKSLRKKG